MFDQLDGFQILITTVHIGNPFPVLSAVIQIKHAGYRIHTDTVRMIFLHPEQCIGDQIVRYLGTTVIVDQGAPVRMTALSGILMLIKTGAVKCGQTVRIPWEMRRHPVKDHTDSRLMQFIHEEHKVLRCTVSGSRCIITDHLISPGSI